MEAFVIPKAYKYVAIAVMLMEINYCAAKLKLPVQHRISPDSLRLAHVSNPFVTGFGGTLETDHYSFVFFKSGVLRRIVRINCFEKVPLRELQWKQSQMKSLISTNEAYQLATNWLSAILVDIAALEKSHPCVIEQTYFYPDARSISDSLEERKRIVLLPIFHVNWGDVKNPTVQVSIFGPTKELLAIHIEDESFSLRPKELLRDVDKLLSIPDSEFARFSAKNRKDLMVRHRAVEYGSVEKYSDKSNSQKPVGTNTHSGAVLGE